MFAFKKLISPFLLPPGLFILILAIVGIWATWRKKKSALLTALGTGVLIWALSSVPVADSLIGGLESGLSIPQSPNGDAIIMLGGGVNDRAPDLSGIGAPGPGTMERLVTAARLQQRLKIPVVVSGGRVFQDSAAIAPIARRFLIDLGIPSHMVIVEDQSRDTYENALFCKQICEQRNFNHPLLVTSGYHMPRALLCFEKVGLAVTPFPCALTTWTQKHYQWQDYLPSAGSLERSAAGLHEQLGLLYYRWHY